MSVQVGFVDESKLGQEELRVALTVGESTTVLDANDVTQLIKLLAGARAAFPGSLVGPKPIDPSEVSIYATDPALALAAPEGGHPPQMLLHHPGYGWVPFRVSEEWVQQLVQLHAQAASVKASTLQ